MPVRRPRNPYEAALQRRRRAEEARAERGGPAGGVRGAGRQPAGGIPFMITRSQKVRLRALGYTEAEIHRMTPAEAHRLLAVAGLGHGR